MFTEVVSAKESFKREVGKISSEHNLNVKSNIYSCILAQKMLTVVPPNGSPVFLKQSKW